MSNERGLTLAERPTPAAIDELCEGAVRFWRPVKDKV